MPELPEVETTRRSLLPALSGRRVESVRVHEPRLRWPVPAGLPGFLEGRCIDAVERRAKYLLFRTAAGTLLAHLGMSGSLRLVDAATPRRTHDHVEIRFEGAVCLRLHDPRRFGCLLWIEGDPEAHPLLRDLGPEPLDGAFDGAMLHARSRGRRSAVKAFIMDAKVVVGVGNIYASEALFRAGIDPRRAAGRLSAGRCAQLAEAIRTVLAEAIETGGTTLRDYVDGRGREGAYVQRLAVYGQAGKPCPRCGGLVRQVRTGQRSTFFCPGCQR